MMIIITVPPEEFFGWQLVKEKFRLFMEQGGQLKEKINYIKLDGVPAPIIVIAVRVGDEILLLNPNQANGDQRDY